MFFQLPLQRTMLEEEDARVENPVVLLEALKNPDPQIQRIAVRAIGRREHFRLAASLWDAEQTRARVVGREDDRAIRSPARAPRCP